MSQHPDESGIVPDDSPLVRPYVAPSGRPPAPAGPQAGTVSFPGPAEQARETTPGPGPGPDPLSPTAPPPAGFGPAAPGPFGTTAVLPAVPPEPGSEPGSARRRVRGSGGRFPMAVLALIALAGAGGLVFLLRGPDPEPVRALPLPGLSAPALPDRGPDAGTTPGPGAPSGAPVRSASAAASVSAPASASVSSSPSTSQSQSQSQGPSPGPKPTSAPSASPTRPPSEASGTLSPGDRGAEVRTLQQRLYGQGFMYVSVTGVYDEQTERGVAQLQRDRDIKGDPKGVYGPATRAAFG
ncbi:peptidoglycan-binding protein [Streptomyces sp. NPDC051567]|uniref:peptidoglycan-binding protein n=1 Tax=Streptomyces sp. NPDC051567 TaxID=3365660 RepID=UPI0037992B8F